MISEIKKAIEFYRGLGFEYLPVRADTRERRTDPLSASPEKDAKGRTAVSRAGGAGVLPGQREAALTTLREEIGDCRRCRLSRGRKNIVFGEGDPDAKLMFIGEGPGREEDLQARPFVGEAGRLLTKLIEKMGFKRGDVYIANMVKCRPPQNRDPDEDEIDTCRPFIEAQIRIIRPLVIMSLGKIASQSLLKTKIPISRLRGTFYDYRDTLNTHVPLMPTFHPAYLLRNPKDKQKTWEDAQKALDELKSGK